MFCYAVSLVMLIVGIAFFTGKAAPFIKGYYSMPEDEKKNINITGLCRNISVLFFIAAVIFGAAGYSAAFLESYFTWAMLGWFALCVIDIVFIGKSKRYEKRRH